MLTKELVLYSLSDLPAKFTLDDVMERIYLLHKIELGLEQSKNGETISMDEAKQLHAKWLKSAGPDKQV
jgi:hypothetical protein